MRPSDPRLKQVEPLRTDAGRGRLARQDVIHLADEEPTYVPVSVAAEAALRVVCELGELRRCVFQ